MKKKILIALGAILLGAVVWLGGYMIYIYNTGLCQISKNYTESSDEYIESWTVIYSPLFGELISPKTEERIFEFNDRNRAVILDIAENCGKPYHIETDMTFEDGRTIVRWYGTYTDESGGTQTYDKAVVYDFILKNHENGTI